MFAGISPDEFEKHPDRKQLRQHAKAFNFGIPGGLSSGALVDYARFTYGVELEVGEAGHFIRKLTHEVYPELGIYLSEDLIQLGNQTLGEPFGSRRDVAGTLPPPDAQEDRPG